MKRPIVVSRGDNGMWTAYHPSTPEVIGTGPTKSYAIANLKEKTDSIKRAFKVWIDTSGGNDAPKISKVG